MTQYSTPQPLVAEERVQHSPAKWADFFMGMAQLAAGQSKDPDRKVGAVVTSPDRRQVSFGYNGFREGVPDLPSLLNDREYKRANMVHAEENCIKQAPFSLVGASMYVTRFPCTKCANKILEAGIATLYAPQPDFRHPRWGASWAAASEMFRANGLIVIYNMGTLYRAASTC